MNTNRWIKASNKLYVFLMRLYPKAYRDEFSEDMQQVFRAECQHRYEKKGVFGIFLYWLKVMPDLAYTAFVEQVSSPTATWGLMEPVPNKPLPWKGVFLVLLPGLVYLVAQIGQYTGRYWYMTVYYRAALYLMIPVVIVWIFKKQFPIWGLIPLGLLFKLARISSTVLLGYIASRTVNIEFMDIVLKNLLRFWPMITMGISLVLIIFLLWRYKKKYPESNQCYKWIVGIAVLSIGYAMYSFYYASTLTFGNASFENMQRIFIEHQTSLYWIFNEALTLVLLVYVGTLFIKRHGFFSIFIFVGYIMPTLIIGFPWNIDQAINQDMAILLMGIAVIGYRVLLTLVSPVWMARMKSQSERKRAIIIPIAFAIAIHGIMLFNQVFFFPDQVTTLYTILDALFTVGIVAFSFLLAVSLYSAGELEPGYDSKSESHTSEIYVYS